MIKRFSDITSFNEYSGLNKPLHADIDVGNYEENPIRLQSKPIITDFYRISIKWEYIDTTAADYDAENPKMVAGVFFSSPDCEMEWDLPSPFKGSYIQFSQKIVNENRFLFKNYLGYGEHEALLLEPYETSEVKLIYNLLLQHYQSEKFEVEVVVSYMYVLVALIEKFYKRQFETNIIRNNHIVSEFQQMVNEYFMNEAKQLPTVKYFADELKLTPNYLGEIIKQATNKTAIDTIQDALFYRAKQLLANHTLTISEIAYKLGFDYPNYFAKAFKKYTEYSPKEYRALKS